MSAILAEVPRPSIIEPPRLSGALAKIINQINRLEKTEHDLIALLPEMSWRDLIATRDSAKLLECTGWKIQIACDNEIWDRHEGLAGGRGQVDAEGKGIKAAVNKRAKEIGVGASTIHANARLYKRFKTVLSTQNSLDEKGFYQAAQSAPDPDAAIIYFQDERGANPFFRPADAWRWVKEQKEAEQGPHVDDIDVLQEPAVVEWLQNLKASMEHQDELLEVITPFPFHLRGMLHFFNRAVAEQLTRTVEGDCEEILTAIKAVAGGLPVDQIAADLRRQCYFISDEDLKARIALMESNNQILKETPGKDAKLDDSRGMPPSFYVPWYKKHESPPRCKKCGEWHRDARECLMIA